MNCLRCGGVMVTVETGADQIGTRFCATCGLMENSFAPEMRKQLLSMAVTQDEKTEQEAKK